MHQVEQSRFVVQPFQLVQQKEETPPEIPSGPPVLSSMSSTHFKPFKYDFNASTSFIRAYKCASFRTSGCCMLPCLMSRLCSSVCRSGRFSTPLPSLATSVEKDEQIDLVETIEESPEELDPVEEMRKKATLDPKYWTCPGAVNFQVRGKNYLKVRSQAYSPDPVLASMYGPDMHDGDVIQSCADKGLACHRIGRR